MGNRRNLAESRVVILGLGLMGGSLALALSGKCGALCGIDPDPGTLELAHRLGIFNLLAEDGKKVLPNTDLIVLATPVSKILSLLDELPELHPGKAAVIDLGSTKSQIVKKMSGLPERFDPLGGHPMCGKERGGLINADESLFQGATFAFTPLSRSSAGVRSFATELSQAVGASPFWLDPETHDRWVASTSHMPYLAANALASVTPEEAGPLVGPGLRSTTRLAATPWTMMRDILETNRPSLLDCLRIYRAKIEALERLLMDEDFQGLERSLAEGARIYDSYKK